MTYTKLSNASYAIKEIEKLCLPFRVSRQIFQLIQKINTEIEFYIFEENKLLKKYNAKCLEDGRINFENSVDFQNYMDEMKELNETEVEISDIPLMLPEELFENIKISPETLINLDGIINFE